MTTVSTTKHMDTNPGASHRGTGPKFPVGQFDHLKLPDNKKIGETDNEALRGWMIKFGVDGATTAGRHILCERYSAMLEKVFDAAGHAAVADFLSKHKV